MEVVNIELLSVSTLDYEPNGKGEFNERLSRTVIRHYACPDLDIEPLKQGDIITFNSGALYGDFMVVKKVTIPPPLSAACY